MKTLSIFTLFFIILFTGCSQKQPIKFTSLPKISKGNLKKISFEDINGFKTDDLAVALDVFKKDCNRAKRYKLFKNVCEKAKTATNPIEFFSKNFTAYELYSDNGSDKGTITGYYEPLLQGSRTKSEVYKYPLYKTPKDMITIDLSDSYPELKHYRLRGKLKNGKIVSYDDRKSIEKRDDLEPICYVDDRLDLFFLQVQGSGKVILDDGKVINVGYANQNGHQYKGIGRILLKEGVLKNYSVSMQGIKQYIKDNPQREDEILFKNRSYIFFEERNQGATGALGAELVGGRNLAVDKRYIPLGMPVFINTKNSVTGKNINRLMVAADTGGAIKGKVRADFFYGTGKYAEIYAGGMKEDGKLTILVPN
jgi:membrane-bound lytic murein transglycosylase A